MLVSAADVEHARRVPRQIVHLHRDQIVEIGDVQDVANLQALAAESDCSQRAAKQMARGPQHEEALIDLAHLPRTRRSRRSG